jgi:outer membrane protein OmpA-like peptidoglycan-associated protein
MARLNTLADRLNSAGDVEGARVVGYADRIGTVSYNEKLSRKRAEAVRDYLIARGVVNSSVTKTRWVGKSEPTADCPKNMTRVQVIDCLQPDRKVEVEIIYRKEVRQ